MKNTKLIALFLIIFCAVVIGGGVYYFLIKKSPVACTLEAKICPDGSSVGRTGPNCEFAKCPEIKTDETADWKTYTNEEYGFEVKYPEFLKFEEIKSSSYIDGFVVLFFNSENKLIKGKYMWIYPLRTSLDYCFCPAVSLSLQFKKPGGGIMTVPVVENFKTEEIKIGNTKFKKESAEDIEKNATPDYYTHYNVYNNKKNNCISFCTVLHAESVISELDRDNELKIFEQIISTFKFIE
jgi:hypothetical protein